MSRGRIIYVVSRFDDERAIILEALAARRLHEGTRVAIVAKLPISNRAVRVVREAAAAADFVFAGVDGSPGLIAALPRPERVITVGGP